MKTTTSVCDGCKKELGTRTDKIGEVSGEGSGEFSSGSEPEYSKPGEEPHKMRSIDRKTPEQKRALAQAAPSPRVDVFGTPLDDEEIVLPKREKRRHDKSKKERRRD
jgi:hypothetical protein